MINITPGQYFHTGEIIPATILGREKLCVAVDGKKITYKSMDATAIKHGEQDCLFFCDQGDIVETFNTLAELQELRQIGREHFGLIREFVSRQQILTDNRLLACRNRHAKEWAAQDGDVRSGADRTTNGSIGQP